MKSKLAGSISPYVAGEQPKDKRYIKLNTNENPYPPAPAVARAVSQYPAENLRLYPSPDSDELKSVIADYYNINAENIFVGNGSDEVLALSFPAFFNPEGTPVLFADITYSFYKVYAKFYGIPYEEIISDDKFTTKAEQYLKARQGVIIASPNAPTGTAFDISGIEKILKDDLNRIMIVDEAYSAFAGSSAVQLINKYKNLLVVQTFSKSFSLAGMRIGFAVGDKELINTLCQIKNCFNSYPLDAVAEQAAIAAFQSKEYYSDINGKVIAERERLTIELTKLGGCVLPSSANFIFVKFSEIGGEKIYLKLKDAGILVRYFDRDRIRDYVRITVGSISDNDILIKELSRIISD